MLRSEIRRNREHCLQQMYAWRQQILPLRCFRIKAMRRVPETNIFLRNNNCTTALSTARCYFEAIDDFPIFLSSRRLFLKISTEIKREDIIQSLMTRKVVIFQEMSSMNADCFRYLVLAGNFLNFRLCEIQLGAQCLLGEHWPLITIVFVLGRYCNSNSQLNDSKALRSFPKTTADSTQAVMQ